MGMVEAQPWGLGWKDLGHGDRDGMFSAMERIGEMGWARWSVAMETRTGLHHLDFRICFPYQQYHENYVCTLDEGDQCGRAQLGKTYQPAELRGALCVNKNEKIICLPKDDTYALFIFLPLNAPVYAGPSYMVVECNLISQSAVENMGLDLAFRIRARKVEGVVSLIYSIGREQDSVRNQREHLILLLANVHIGLQPQPDTLWIYIYINVIIRSMSIPYI